MRARWREFALLCWSAAFYFWGEPRFFWITLLSTIADYFICQQIFNSQGTPTARNYMAFGVMLNVMILLYFKYINFFLDSINAILNFVRLPSVPLLNIALPIGVSFLVFEKMTYLVDVYRGHSKPAPSLHRYLLYVLLFPKLLAGPIVKYRDIEAQLIEQNWTCSGFFEGFERFLLGLVKKVLLADTFSEVVNEAFAIPPQHLGFTSAWLGVICFTLQIYFDFSAYSDMAIGLGRMFGFHLLENFNMPYIATSFTDFWQRWHISLSTWIKEYLYIPLGGNRKGTLRSYFNLGFCFLISGLWHGPNWTFVLWGAYHGLFVVVDKLFWLNFSKRLPSMINLLLTLFFIMIGWALFRATSIAQFSGFVHAMFSTSKEGAVIFLTANEWTAIAVGSILSLVPAVKHFDAAMTVWRSFKASRLVESLALSGFALIALGKTMAVTFNPFLYFRF
ncbi:MBOAT family O-acyltransferase [Scytonema sp. PCC 10023]|uniref:MBOAT family O-acyltransferase n=1 Tax=Scytonema sp. PCC 10023 TaxID=1680591 RepID=UPI0039C6471A